MSVLVESASLPLSILIGVVGLVVLVVSADRAVDRLVGLANYFNLSTTFVGMTVVSLATSIPEISAHLTASFGILDKTLDYKVGSSIVLGANIGSDVVQQTLIMGIVVFLAGSLFFERSFLTKNMLPMIGTTLMCIILGFDGVYSRVDGAILFGSFIAYSYYLYRDDRRNTAASETVALQDDEVEEVEGPQTAREAATYAFSALLFMTLTIFAAEIVLNVTEKMVSYTGIGGSLIGVLTLGIASALPELTTAISGVRNKEQGISLGTLIGSNITNPLVAIGGGALVSTYFVPRPLITWDLPWETLTGLMLWVILWFRKGKIGKWGALYFVGIYFVYLYFRATVFAVD